MCNTSYGYNNNYCAYIVLLYETNVRDGGEQWNTQLFMYLRHAYTRTMFVCVDSTQTTLHCRAMGKHVMFAWIFHTCNIIHYGVFFFSTIARAWKSFPRPHGACGRGKKTSRYRQAYYSAYLVPSTLHVYVGTIMYRKQNEGKWTLTKTFRKSFAECLSKPRVVSVGNWKGNTKVDDRRGSRDCCGDEKNENMCFACGIRIVIVISQRYTYCTL